MKLKKLVIYSSIAILLNSHLVLINNDKDFKGALVIINGIIAKNKDIYIRIS